jgi:diguanylate cyclase (GGDEF)-like protein/PAS domain S-box-containing protein
MKSPKTKRATKGVMKRRRSFTPELTNHRFAQIAKRIFESFPDAILLIESDGKMSDANAQAQSIFGYGREELIGKPADVLIIERCRELFVKHISGTVAGPQVRLPGVGLELFGRRKNQGEFPMEIILSSIASDDDSLVMVVVRDLTEAKQAAERARRTNAELTSLVAELQRRDHEMQALISMDDLLQSCTSQEEAYKIVALAAGELFESQTGCLAVMHASGQFLEVVARWGDGPLGDPIFSVEDCWALRRGQVHEVTDPDAGLLCRHVVRQADKAYLCMPLTVQGETLGIFCLAGARDKRNTNQVGQLQLVVTVSEAIKLSLSNLKLREKLRAEAIHDPLTGLFNRRYLEETLPRELHRARRTNAPLSVVMLDLDGFKRFNDTYGHDAGDALLRELGKLVREKLRKSDISCRYGGEEFVLVLPDSSLADAEQRVEQIRAQIKEMQIPHGDQLLRAITVSAGVAQADERTANPNELLRAADSALYAAKNAGRDRVVVYRGKETLQSN